MKIIEIITENKQIALTKKAFASLSYEARNAIDAWESSNWIGGPLERHVIANDAVAQEIEQAFQPVRDSIPGDTVRLYRGVQHSDAEHTRHLKDRVLESWTSERAVAEYFAGLRTDQNKQGRSRIIKLPTMQDIDNAVAKYNATGYVKFRGHHYVRIKNNPQYYNIYDRHRQHVTDGDNLKRDLTYWLEDEKKWNDKRLKQSTVLEQDIDKSRIVWITNNLNSKEYIIRVK